ncbi:MAG: ATP phosphoribosyltransferase regulatory subunit [Firmicutes bacterium]|nr:ATP phosphoribosyltransferase regulatory subunit [Bacillota bacterium]
MGTTWRTPYGLKDWWGAESREIERWRRHYVEMAAHAGYEPIELPIFELTRTFSELPGPRISLREAYRFVDVGGDDLTLRWTFVNALQRAAIQHAWNLLPHPLRVFYSGPLLRRTSPESGEYRQWTAFGMAAYGPARPLMLADVILTLAAGLKWLGAPVAVELTAIPDEPESSQESWLDAMAEHLGDAGISCMVKSQPAPRGAGHREPRWLFHILHPWQGRSVVIAEGAQYATDQRSPAGEALVLVEGHLSCTALVQRWGMTGPPPDDPKPILVIGDHPRALHAANRLRRAGRKVQSLFTAVPESELQATIVMREAEAAIVVEADRLGTVSCVWPSGVVEPVADELLIDYFASREEGCQ